MEWPTQRLSSCETFSGMPSPEKRRVLEKLTACGRCSSWMHSTPRCPSNNLPGCQMKEGGQVCGGKHIEALHGGGSYISMGMRVGGGVTARLGSTQGGDLLEPPPSALTASGFPGNLSLLAVNLVPAVGKCGVVHLLNTMSDEGSQVTLLTKRAAKRLQLGPGNCGIPVQAPLHHPPHIKAQRRSRSDQGSYSSYCGVHRFLWQPTRPQSCKAPFPKGTGRSLPEASGPDRPLYRGL